MSADGVRANGSARNANPVPAHPPERAWRYGHFVLRMGNGRGIGNGIARMADSGDQGAGVRRTSLRAGRIIFIRRFQANSRKSCLLLPIVGRGTVFSEKVLLLQ